MKSSFFATAAFAAALLLPSLPLQAQPEVLVPNLAVRTTVSGLNQPTGMAFLSANDFFVIEKASGQVNV